VNRPRSADSHNLRWLVLVAAIALVGFVAGAAVLSGSVSGDLGILTMSLFSVLILEVLLGAAALLRYLLGRVRARTVGRRPG
jgi:hypothetical protein